MESLLVVVPPPALGTAVGPARPAVRLLVLTGSTAATAATAATGARVAAFAGLFVIVRPPVLVPVVLTTVLGSDTDRALGSIYGWVGAHYRMIGVVTEVVFALHPVSKGTTALP